MNYAFQQPNWENIGKLWGPLGVVFTIFVLLILGAAKLFRQFLTETIADARKERDLMRGQLKEQAEQFTQSLRFRDEKMSKGFDDIVNKLTNENNRRGRN